ncbi:hypothetical protein [Lentilitoribacter sp. EG35]|jgi:hypothetical protein|uniref:hypothetical protein n=1 Tax=Lentilitoribacter sp. EG35 TaxID=3234192 RepID=UPI0034608AF8
MIYNLSLKQADVPDPHNGDVNLGLHHEGAEIASIDLHWDNTQFTGRFNGFAPDLPTKAHPMAYIKAAIDAIYNAKVTPDEPISSVFGRSSLQIDV